MGRKRKPVSEGDTTSPKKQKEEEKSEAESYKTISILGKVKFQFFLIRFFFIFKS